jgi:hypothetical protein
MTDALARGDAAMGWPVRAMGALRDPFSSLDGHGWPTGRSTRYPQSAHFREAG